MVLGLIVLSVSSVLREWYLLTVCCRAATTPAVATSVLTLESQADKTQNDNTDSEWKGEKCHIKVRPTDRTPEDRKGLFDDSKVVLRGGKLYVQLSSYSGTNHPFTGYYLPYPDMNFEGLVSTISDEPPQLNWIYLDTSSKILQINHGLRVEADEGVPGPWGARVCENGEINYLMETWEGFVVVETDEPGLWSLCFDRYDDGLKGKLDEGRRTVEVELIRDEIAP